MKISVILFTLLFSVSAVSKAGPNNDVYQVTLRAQKSEMQMFICIKGECQKSLSHKEFQDGYLYDFGTFSVPDAGNIELRVWKRDPEERRIRRARENYASGICEISSCGSFSFSKVNTPATSTTDTCQLGLSCSRGETGIR